MKQKKTILAMALFCLSLFVFAQKQYKFESIPNDPMKVRIYTLENGLKVYLTVYKNEPRISAAIAVRTGSKNDPSDNTGLSHYLEHMMFKGTENYGTTDFPKEKVFLNQIDSLFEVYRKISDTTKRKFLYHNIDSVSGLAAKYAIASEYDKMMSVIGGKNINAFTSLEETVYVNDVPSNQIENWCNIEFERFSKPVFRLFHTELEAVYEEKNMGLDRDGEKLDEAFMSGLFRKNNYGTQTTIGTIDHLKNPSLISLKKYFNEKYVPNNMAICLSGDFDPDKVIKMIDERFGKLQRKDIKPYVPAVEDPIKEPIVKEVFGPDAEQMIMGYLIPKANTREADLATLMSSILSNNKAGLIDLNLNQAQKVLNSGCYFYTLKDYSIFGLYGNNKQGQKLEEVKDLLLSQIEEVKKGNFPDWLITAVINDMKLSLINQLENNNSRKFAMVDAFIKDTPWSDYIGDIERISKLTKKDVVDFANKYFSNNYVVVYKRTGEDKNVQKVKKPQITPVPINRVDQSQFVKNVIDFKTEPISPVFIDFDKDITKFNIKNNIPVLYKENTENKRFNLYYYFEMGTDNDKKLDLAVNYLKYLGTSKLKPAEVQQELYKIGCSFDVNSDKDQIWVSLSGLSENMEKGITLFENLLAEAQPNKDALANLVSDQLKQRNDNKLSKDFIMWNALYNYGMYGSKSSFTNILSEKELNELKPEELISIIKGLNSYNHKVLYYGPENKDKVTSTLNKLHNVPAQLKPIPAQIKFEELETKETKVFAVDYDMKQADVVMLSRSEIYNKNNISIRRIFNEYFGGSMASVVFQELREAKALAYSAYAGYRSPNKPDEHHYIFSFIGTQNDKLPEAMTSMFGILNNMPESEKSFSEAKTSIINQFRTERITKTEILFNYLSVTKMGNNHDMRKDVFEQVPNLKMTDLKAFVDKNIKDKKYTILVVGKKDNLDIKTLEKYGKVQFLDLKESFGY